MRHRRNRAEQNRCLAYSWLRLSKWLLRLHLFLLRSLCPWQRNSRRRGLLVFEILPVSLHLYITIGSLRGRLLGSNERAPLSTDLELNT